MEEVYIYGELVMLFFLLYPSTPREGFLFYFFIFQIWVGGTLLPEKLFFCFDEDAMTLM
jgi:hypothetical protein